LGLGFNFGFGFGFGVGFRFGRLRGLWYISAPRRRQRHAARPPLAQRFERLRLQRELGLGLGLGLGL